MIPKNIFQTHKSRKYINENKKLRKACDSWLKNKEYNYNFFDDIQCDNFIYKFFPEMKDAYDKLPLRVMKADLWRYCIIYKYGGIYADADTVLLKNPCFLINNKYLTVVPENNTHFCQWVFSGSANSPVLKSVINLLVERIRSTKEIKGEHIVHYLTGPGVFTDGILNYLFSNEFSRVYDKNRNILDFEVPYDLIKVGNSEMNTKTIKLDKNHPSDTELTFIHNYKDMFSYKFNGNELIIRRIDENQGWGQDLTAYRFNSLFNIIIFTSSIFHKECVKHLFSGQWSDGWCYKRDKLLKR